VNLLNPVSVSPSARALLKYGVLQGLLRHGYLFLPTMNVVVAPQKTPVPISPRAFAARSGLAGGESVIKC
jgi:hypothetical protein